MERSLMAEMIFTVDGGPSAIFFAHGRHKHRLFPSIRLLLAVLLCLCFVALSVTSSNIAMGMACMTACQIDGYNGELDWSPNEIGVVFAAQNVGSLLMIVTGAFADRLNGKLLVMISVVLCIIANLIIPLLAPASVWFAVGARLLVGVSDACLQPSVNSLITRWFPSSERAAAIGFITGGRQIGSLLILPAGGYLCTRKDILEGWPAIFYLSAIICSIAALFWLPLGADKPSKQMCTSKSERQYIEGRIEWESLGKRTHLPAIPWRSLMRSKPLWVGIFALVCHEFPLVLLLQFLPNYLRDVLEVSPARNGLCAALPNLCLWISKTASSSLSSFIASKTKGVLTKTTIVKLFNAVASAGLAVCVCSVPMFNDGGNSTYAIFALCGAMTFAGLHTPGVQTALVQLAPPFSGVVTGLAFFFVACFSIGNKLLTKAIVQTGELAEWRIVFQLSAFVAALPIVVFSVWGSAERQHWAAPKIRRKNGHIPPTLSYLPSASSWTSTTSTTSTTSAVQVITPSPT
uniref:Major facilitator superfamily (MFS) profile domain-containing protein n=1 Tax=Plectus sambesii TaxID=2011161 RepID=A0A914XQ86_9BILA